MTRILDAIYDTNVAVVAAHHDDELIFFGEIILASLAIARSLIIIVCSNVRPDGLADLCRKLRVVGYSLTSGYWGKDGDRETNRARSDVAAAWMVPILRQHNVTTVFTHGKGAEDGHLHAYHKTVKSACRKAREELGFSLFSVMDNSDNDTPARQICKELMSDHYPNRSWKWIRDWPHIRIGMVP